MPYHNFFCFLYLRANFQTTSGGSLDTEFALYGSKSLSPKTFTFFFPLSEVSTRVVTIQTSLSLAQEDPKLDSQGVTLVAYRQVGNYSYPYNRGPLQLLQMTQSILVQLAQYTQITETCHIYKDCFRGCIVDT